MAMYGYPQYQYCQSDELAKQMFAQQALATSIPHDRSSSEPHVMPIPTGIPWNMQGVTWGMQKPPNLVQFTGQLAQCETNIPPVIHCKRKSLDVEPVIPAKQLITEEKMAAHLNSLHISSDYTSHSSADEEFMDIAVDSQSSAISSKLKGHKIILADEIKKLQKEPLLPAALIERLEKPQMSLVVWKPREHILDKIKEIEDDKSEKSESHEGDTKKRNGLLVVEPSGMDIEM